MNRIIFIFLCFIFMGNLSAQTTVVYSFQIWKNSVNLGTFTATTSTDNGIAPLHATTSPMLAQLCPGDQLTIKQNCMIGSGPQPQFQNLDFNSSSWATIALTNSNTNTLGITPIGSVCPDPVPTPCLTGAPNFGSWLWNSSVTVTIPTNPTSENYLALANNIVGTQICGLIVFIPINLAPTTSIADQTICPGDVVSVTPPSGFTYANWSPNNPNTISPSTTTNYTVDIIHTASGCTQSENFKIYVGQPDVDLSMVRSLCYNESTVFTSNDFANLGNGTTSPMSLTANGVTIFDQSQNIMNIPHVINAQTYGVGIVTLDYTYVAHFPNNSITCTKSYEIVIHPKIELDLQSTYGFCAGNFQPICATTNGLPQPGVTYVWRKSGVPFPVGSGVCFTPSSFGTYFVSATDEFGCHVRQSFTVYDTGVGIKHPANITFCSIDEPEPNYIGWSSDPFGPIQYSFNWTYTDVSGTTTPISNTGLQYQVPYLGPGTYTAVVSANGCTETISIVVTDLYQFYNNHSNAAFSFTPLGGNQVSCQPTVSMPGTIPLWIVVNQSTNTQVPATTSGAGITFNYVTGVQYLVTFRRLDVKGCKEYKNQFTWVDNFRKHRRDNVTNNNTKLDAASTTVSTFPNPTTGLVNIQLTDAETAETQIQVLNALGQVVLNKQVQNQTNIEIDLSKETSGLYILQIVNGDSQFSEKIIKE